MLEERDDKNEILTDQNDTTLKNKILERAVNSPAIFKSQQKDEPELTRGEKEKIANDLLENKKNHVKFLKKFGKYLDSNLLNYFIIDKKNNNYELSYYINKLNRYFDGKTREIDIKNRRYEALKELIEKGEYFSEIEMMRRNPLLYDNLVGKYMTEEDIKMRDNLDTKNITFVNLLLEKIDRDGIKSLKNNQKKAEDNVFEENDSDSDDDDDDDVNINDKWGEIPDGSAAAVDKHEKVKTRQLDEFVEIDDEEQHMLRQEFKTHMYQSFLDGKDKDFDYSTVDDNEAYDNVDLREQDEEEKYFDSESPGSPADNPENFSEDELDKYMKSLKMFFICLRLFLLGIFLMSVEGMATGLLEDVTKADQIIRPKVKRAQELLMFGNQQNRRPENPAAVLTPSAEKRTLGTSGLEDVKAALAESEPYNHQKQKQQSLSWSHLGGEPQREQNYEYGKVVMNEVNDDELPRVWDLPPYPRYFGLDDERRKRSEKNSATLSPSSLSSSTTISPAPSSLSPPTTQRPIAHLQQAKRR